MPPLATPGVLSAYTSRKDVARNPYIKDWMKGTPKYKEQAVWNKFHDAILDAAGKPLTRTFVALRPAVINSGNPIPARWELWVYPTDDPESAGLFLTHCDENGKPIEHLDARLGKKLQCLSDPALRQVDIDKVAEECNLANKKLLDANTQAVRETFRETALKAESADNTDPAWVEARKAAGETKSIVVPTKIDKKK